VTSHNSFLVIIWTQSSWTWRDCKEI